MLFTDTLSFDHPRKTADGYMVVRARAARAGIYDYLGSEVDPEGKHGFKADQIVKVYRPEEEVFAADSVASFLMKPVTNDHPSQPVTAENWRDNAKGVVGKALRDGDFLAFDIVLMDKGIIQQVESGKRELSNGYASLIDFAPGETEAGEHYDAVQKQIRGNHVAVVGKGRAGPMCRIGDAAACAPIPASEVIEILTDGQTYNDDEGGNKNAPARRETSIPGGGGNATQDGDRTVATKTILRDGFSIEVTDQAEVYIQKLEASAKELQDKLTASETALADANKAKSTLEGEKAALETKLKDAELKPDQLEKLVKDRADLIAQAKGIDPNVVTDGKADAEIRKAVVVAKLGDAAAAMNDDAIGGAFGALAKDVKADSVRNALSGGVVSLGDAKAEYEAAQEKRKAALRDGYKAPAPAAAANA